MKKGFTLIELLAVIVVLAIIALIVTPVISNIIASTKKRAAVTSTQNYVDSINNSYALAMIDSNYDYLKEKEILETGFDDNELSEVKISGKTPSYIRIEYDKSRNRVKEGKFCIDGTSIDYINGVASESENDYCHKELAPGLYDKDNNLLYSWDSLENDYGIDLDWWGKTPVEYYTEGPSGQNADPDDFSQYKFYYFDSDYKKVYVSFDSINIGDTARPSIILCKSDFNNVKKLVFPKDIGMIPDSTFENFSREWDIVVPSGITRIGKWAFQNSNITSIAIGPDVTDIDAYAFSYTRKLKKIYLPDNVTRIGRLVDNNDEHDQDVFNSSSVEEIRLSNNITVIPYGFCRFCKNLKSIEIPASVKEVRYMAFTNAFSLKTVILHEGLEKINYGFAVTYNIDSITIPNSVTEMVNSAFEYAGLKSLTLGTGLATIPDYAFFYNKLTSVVIPDEVKKISKGAFADNPITSLDLGHGVEEIGVNAFVGSIGFETLTIPSSVKKIGTTAFYASSGSNNLKTLTFENPNNWVKEGTCDPLDLTDPTTNAATFTSNYQYNIIHYDNIADCH